MTQKLTLLLADRTNGRAYFSFYFSSMNHRRPAIGWSALV